MKPWTLTLSMGVLEEILPKCQQIGGFCVCVLVTIRQRQISNSIIKDAPHPFIIIDAHGCIDSISISRPNFTFEEPSNKRGA